MQKGRERGLYNQLTLIETGSKEGVREDREGAEEISQRSRREGKRKK